MFAVNASSGSSVPEGMAGGTGAVGQEVGCAHGTGAGRVGGVVDESGRALDTDTESDVKVVGMRAVGTNSVERIKGIVDGASAFAGSFVQS